MKKFLLLISIFCLNSLLISSDENMQFGDQLSNKMQRRAERERQRQERSEKRASRRLHSPTQSTQNAAEILIKFRKKNKSLSKRKQPPVKKCKKKWPTKKV